MEEFIVLWENPVTRTLLLMGVAFLFGYSKGKEKEKKRIKQYLASGKEAFMEFMKGI